MPMKKLYTRCLQAELNIQGLRTELQEAENEGRGQRDELLETDRRVCDLYVTLEAKKQMRRDIAHELATVARESNECDLKTLQIETECDELCRRITQSHQSIKCGTEMLKTMEMLRERELEAIQLSKHDLHARSQQSVLAQQRSYEVRQLLFTTVSQERGFREELEYAAVVVDRLRSEENRTRSLEEFQNQRAERAELRKSELRVEVERLEEENSERSKALKAAEACERETKVLFVQHQPNLATLERLKHRLEEATERKICAQRGVRDLEHSIEILSKQLPITEHEVQESRILLDLQQTDSRNYEHQIHITQMESTMERLDARQAETRQEETASDMSVQEDEFSEGMKLLEASASTGRQNIDELRIEYRAKAEEHEEMAETISKLQRDVELMREKRAEVVEAVRDLKAKWRCTTQ